MERKKAEDFDQELLILFDAYVHGAIDRRGFLDRAGKFAVGGTTAAMLLAALSPRFAEAQQVPKDDPRLRAEYLEYPSPEGSGTMRGYLVRPAKAKGKLPAAAHWLKAREDCSGRIGAVGFCYGGGIANMLATRVPDLRAAVPFYGNQPKAEDVPKIKSPLLIHYAEKDERINAGWPAYEAALKASKVPYEAFTYPGTQHGFNNDTTPRYDKDAATLAWKRTVEFFRKHLRG